MICSDFKLVSVIGGLCILAIFSNAEEQSDNYAEISRVLGSSFSVFNRCADKDFTLCLKVKLLLKLKSLQSQWYPKLHKLLHEVDFFSQTPFMKYRFIRIDGIYDIGSTFHDKAMEATNYENRISAQNDRSLQSSLQ